MTFLQIVNWRNHLRFPEEVKISPEAKDLISRLLCNVEQRIGTKGAHEIKVFLHCYIIILCFHLPMKLKMNIGNVFNYRHIPGLKVYNGTNYIRWRLPSYPKLMMNWIRRTLRSLMR